jgi:hypothetical protein
MVLLLQVWSVYREDHPEVVCIYLFICVLFDDAVSSSDYIALDDTMINK